jgi:membrane-anchored mycosin MYCP
VRGLLRTVVALSAAAGCVAVPVVPAGAAPGPVSLAPGDRCAEPGQQFTAVPWPQQMLGPERAWSLAQGGGVVVAVLDSGVDASHPQLSGQVQAGFDAVAGSGRADDDCAGTGTQVAGVIAARQISSIGFAGVAPRAQILPIRVVDGAGTSGRIAQPDVLARGINAAVDRGAHIIAVSAVSYSDTPALAAAVGRALERGVVVVAAVGDEGSANKPPTPYPADYDGVIGVGAIDQSGVPWRSSPAGDYVDLVAPGGEVVTLQRGQGMVAVDGTGVAAGFVAATAALVRARRGGLAPAEMERQLTGSAIPAARGGAYGRGIVNPYNAVTDRLAAEEPAALPEMARPSNDRHPAWDRARDLALVGAGLATGAVLVVLVVAVALPRGRRRLWRSAVRPAPVTRDEPEEPAPPRQLFS